MSGTTKPGEVDETETMELGTGNGGVVVVVEVVLSSFISGARWDPLARFLDQVLNGCWKSEKQHDACCRLGSYG